MCFLVCGPLEEYQINKEAGTPFYEESLKSLEVSLGKQIIWEEHKQEICLVHFMLPVLQGVWGGMDDSPFP